MFTTGQHPIAYSLPFHRHIHAPQLGFSGFDHFAMPTTPTFEAQMSARRGDPQVELLYTISLYHYLFLNLSFCEPKMFFQFKNFANVQLLFQQMPGNTPWLEGDARNLDQVGGIPKLCHDEGCWADATAPIVGGIPKTVQFRQKQRKLKVRNTSRQDETKEISMKHVFICNDSNFEFVFFFPISAMVFLLRSQESGKPRGRSRGRRQSPPGG